MLDPLTFDPTGLPAGYLRFAVSRVSTAMVLILTFISYRCWRAS